jgi:hypothetical protein
LPVAISGALAARVLESGCFVDDENIEKRVIVGNGGKLGDQPRYKVNADHRHLARHSGSEERPPARGPTVENGDAQMRQMRPGRDLLRPYGRGDELGGNDEGVPAVPVANEISERCERGSAFAGAERRDGKAGVGLVQECREALLIGTQDATGERSVHAAIFRFSAAFDLE